MHDDQVYADCFVATAAQGSGYLGVGRLSGPARPGGGCGLVLTRQTSSLAKPVLLQAPGRASVGIARAEHVTVLVCDDHLPSAVATAVGLSRPVAIRLSLPASPAIG